MNVNASAKKNEREAPLTIAISGATGFVGKRLTEKLLDEGSKVKVLTNKRNKALARLSLGPKIALNPNVSVHKWETITGKLEWTDAIRGCDGVVNLAGAPVATRWDKKYKETLVSSRIGCTNRIVDAINKLPEKERPSLVSSSAVGYYGTTRKTTTTRAGKRRRRRRRSRRRRRTRSGREHGIRSLFLSLFRGLTRFRERGEKAVSSVKP